MFIFWYIAKRKSHRNIVGYIGGYIKENVSIGFSSIWYIARRDSHVNIVGDDAGLTSIYILGHIQKIHQFFGTSQGEGNITTNKCALWGPTQGTSLYGYNIMGRVFLS